MNKIHLKIGDTPNYSTVEIGDLRLHFSYSTVIGFEAPGFGFVVSENCWGTVTGKHLNRLDGGSSEAKKRRLPRDEFERQLKALESALLGGYALAFGGGR